MKLSYISLLTATLAAIAASVMADGEPVALFKRQPPDRHRKAGDPPRQSQPSVSSDPSRRAPRVAPHQGQTQPHQQPLHTAGHLQAHHHLQAHLQAHPPQPQLELSRSAMLHNFLDEQSYQNRLPPIGTNPRKRHDRHTAVAIANEDAARSNRLVVYGAKLAKSEGTPSRQGFDWDTIIDSHKDEANSRQQKTEDHKRSANAQGAQHAIRIEESKAAERDALRSKNKADWASDKTWRMIYNHHPWLHRKDHEDEAEKEFMQTHVL